MNKRTVKWVKNPKACRHCKHCVADNPSDVNPRFACRIKPIEAGDSTCKDKLGEPPYQVFLRVPSDRGLPSVALYSEKDSNIYPADHVKLHGVVVNEPDGWDIVNAICSKLNGNSNENDNLMRARELIGNSVLQLLGYLYDIQAFGDDLSRDSAMALVGASVTCVKRIIEVLHLNEPVKDTDL